MKVIMMDMLDGEGIILDASAYCWGTINFPSSDSVPPVTYVSIFWLNGQILNV